MSKEELAKMVEEFDKKAEFFKDHPYEVSHYSQDMIKKHEKENYWTDQAEPTTPSFNDEDTKAKSHPMGFTVAQLSEEGMIHRHPPNHFHQNQRTHEEMGQGHVKTWWGDGNGGGSEKVDAF
jgi:hypothetical protein